MVAAAYVAATADVTAVVTACSPVSVVPGSAVRLTAAVVFVLGARTRAERNPANSDSSG